MIAAHTGAGGDRQWRTTKSVVAAHFSWEDIDKDKESFVRSCFHCVATEPEIIVTRSLGHALHADLLNAMLNLYFCYIKAGEADFTYVLILKDYH